MIRARHCSKLHSDGVWGRQQRGEKVQFLLYRGIKPRRYDKTDLIKKWSSKKKKVVFNIVSPKQLREMKSPGAIPKIHQSSRGYGRDVVARM